MKIKDILKEEPQGGRLVNKRVDPDTGAISHDVRYNNIYYEFKSVHEAQGFELVHCVEGLLGSRGYAYGKAIWQRHIAIY